MNYSGTPALLDVRLWGLQAVITPGMGAPLDSPEVEIGAVNLFEDPGWSGPTLLGGPVTNHMIAYIDYSITVTRTYSWGNEIAPAISFFSDSFDPSIPAPLYYVKLEPFGSIDTSSETLTGKGQRYYIRGMRFKNGSQTVESPASGPIATPNRFLYDTGNRTTQISEVLASDLGITTSTPVDETKVLDGVLTKGYIIDRIEIDAGNGSNTYVINDALVFVKPPPAFGGAADANIGSNFFETTQMLFDGPLSRLGLYTGAQCNPPPVDVYILVDLSGSFMDDLDNFKAEAPAMIDTLRGKNLNTRFGLGRFEDYPIYPFGLDGDNAYQRVLDLSPDPDPVKTTIAGLTISSGAAGGDWPQSQLAALYYAATGAEQDLSGAGYPDASIPAGQQANFRNGATKIFVLWTDAPFHNPGDAQR